MKEHQFIYHNGAQAKFKMEVLQVFKDTLSRQISEAVRIEHAVRDGFIFIVSNEKSEWHSVSLVPIASEVQNENLVVENTGVTTSNLFTFKSQGIIKII